MTMRGTAMKRSVTLAAVLFLAPAGAGAKTRAAARGVPSPPIAERSAKADRPPRAPRADDEGGESLPSPGKTADGKTIKTKTYTFGAMDVEGKLKTPQLLYFLNRVKLELDMSAPDKRSFMKELVKSADDKSL
jgi:hypothetical protein